MAEKEKDILDEVKRVLEDQSIRPSAPPDVKQTTIARLREAAQSKGSTVGIWRGGGTFRTTKTLAAPLARIAAAVVFLVGVGFVAGRFSAPSAPELEDAQAALEASMVGLFAGLEQTLHDQVRRDVAAYGAATSKLLGELILEFRAIQVEDRHRFAAAIEQVELNRRLDRTWARNGLYNLALLTEEAVLRPRQDAAERPSTAEGLVPNSDEHDRQGISERKD